MSTQDDDFMPDTTAATKPQQKKYSKDNRGAVMIDQFGKREYKRKPISGLDISQPLLSPITRGGIAKYRAIPTKDDPDGQREILLEGSYTVFDRFEQDPSKAYKHMKNFTGRKERIKDKNGNDMEVDEINMVQMHNGYISVNQHKDWTLYQFMELYPRNASNKFRDNALPPEFERIDLTQSPSTAFKLAQEDMEDEAKAEIKAMVDIDQICGLAVSAGIATMEGDKRRDMALIKSDLRAYAAKSPRAFFSLTQNSKMAIKMTLIEADSFGVITYLPDTKKWITDITDEPLHVVMVGEDPIDSFAKFLNGGDDHAKAIYGTIREILDRWVLRGQ